MREIQLHGEQHLGKVTYNIHHTASWDEHERLMLDDIDDATTAGLVFSPAKSHVRRRQRLSRASKMQVATHATCLDMSRWQDASTNTGGVIESGNSTDEAAVCDNAPDARTEMFCVMQVASRAGTRLHSAIFE